MPSAVPTLDPDGIEELGELGWTQLAGSVLTALFRGNLPSGRAESLAAEALDFPIPLVPVGERIRVLELFHGPTLAFKDVGARVMARLLGHFRTDRDSPITVLTATSGDTGGAVAHALHGMQGVRIVVLFPDGKVTPRQERQFSTLGGNVTAVAVRGDFDDCQRMAKEAFGLKAPVSGLRLTSANSINVGRFLPQTTYFFQAWAETKRLFSNRTPILFSVPSGNFGNLAAGLLAKAMGLPNASFVAATNRNDVVPEYLQTGLFSPRPSTTTLSTAMDVGNPSNLDRILHLYRGSLEGVREDVVGQRVTDTETEDCIRLIHRETGYTLDPHTAVGYRALERELERRPDAQGIVLATAHPAKFAEVVEPIIGKNIPIPAELMRCMEGEREVTSVEPRVDALLELLNG